MVIKTVMLSIELGCRLIFLSYWCAGKIVFWVAECEFSNWAIRLLLGSQNILKLNPHDLTDVFTRIIESYGLFLNCLKIIQLH